MKDKQTSEGTLERLIREPEREHITGIPKVSWWEMERQGRAPRRVRIGKRTIVWRLSDLLDWIDDVADGGDWAAR